MKRVLICGSRTWNKIEPVVALIEKLPEGTVIIQGDAPGADTIAKACAIERGFEVLSFPADWDKFGKSAGFKRNRQMINEGEPNLVVAFIDTNWKSPGTHGMIELSEACALQVIRIEMACEPVCSLCGELSIVTEHTKACGNSFHECKECVWKDGALIPCNSLKKQKK